MPETWAGVGVTAFVCVHARIRGEGRDGEVGETSNSDEAWAMMHDNAQGEPDSRRDGTADASNGTSTVLVGSGRQRARVGDGMASAAQAGADVRADFGEDNPRFASLLHLTGVDHLRKASFYTACVPFIFPPVIGHASVVA